MSDELAPPGVALAALRCFSHEPNYEAILGDLNEEFHQRLMPVWHPGGETPVYA